MSPVHPAQPAGVDLTRERISWPREFARVVRCASCTKAHSAKLLRDDAENVPQPGYVGANYEAHRVLLVGQNPGTPKSLSTEDLPYTAALRTLRDDPSEGAYEQLRIQLESFIVRWPVHGNYFPLRECGLSLEDIAYTNVVRCRTLGDAAPSRALTDNCVVTHFERWLDVLAPRIVVFIGKWAVDHARDPVASRGIAFVYMNRQRSLSGAERRANRDAVVAAVLTARASG